MNRLDSYCDLCIHIFDVQYVLQGESDLTYWLMGKVGSKFIADGVMRTTPQH